MVTHGFSSTGGMRGVLGLKRGANQQSAESMFVFAPVACVEMVPEADQ